MTGIGTTVTGVFGDLDAELLVVAPVAAVTAGILWGIPKAVGFFKRVAK